MRTYLMRNFSELFGLFKPSHTVIYTRIDTIAT